MSIGDAGAEPSSGDAAFCIASPRFPIVEVRRESDLALEGGEASRQPVFQSGFQRLRRQIHRKVEFWSR
jgi:hypothetical protein